MLTRFFFLLLCILLGSSSLSFALEEESSLNQKRNLQDYDRCDWLVRYRNRTYDLAPLTRGSLGRPLEGDIRAVIRRVPEAGLHLDRVEEEARLSKVHSMVGSAGITALLLGRIFRNDPKIRENPSSQKTIDIIGLLGLAVFIKSTMDSHFSHKKSEEELVAAVESFNQNSPYKIEPFKEER